jgi:hypothetical protein
LFVRNCRRFRLKTLPQHVNQVEFLRGREASDFILKITHDTHPAFTVQDQNGGRLPPPDNGNSPSPTDSQRYTPREIPIGANPDCACRGRHLRGAFGIGMSTLLANAEAEGGKLLKFAE